MRGNLLGNTVPSKVDYFFNRWQTNEPFPNDFIRDGNISCQAKQCDQSEQSTHKNEDGSSVKVTCGWLELGCSERRENLLNPYPGNRMKRAGHSGLATDGWVESSIKRIIDNLKASTADDRTLSHTSPGTQFLDTVDIPISQLGTPGSFDARFRAVNDWAVRNGYAAAFPNFHQADYGRGVVYGTILLKQGVEKRDIPASELGNPANNEARFRAVHDWATRNGYVAGFPNFHQADYGQGVVYGTILLKK
jgi:hypothetical protein